MSRLASSLLDGQPAVLHHNPSAGAEAKHFGHVLSLPLYPLLVLLSLFTSCREGSFSETGLPVYGVLGNWASGFQLSRKLRDKKRAGVLPTLPSTLP